MLSACGQVFNEAQSLHFRYGSLVALSTLSPICCLLRPKTRFPVRRLHLLSGREFHPLGTPGFVLAHHSAGTRWRSAVIPLLPVAYLASFPTTGRLPIPLPSAISGSDEVSFGRPPDAR